MKIEKYCIENKIIIKFGKSLAQLKQKRQFNSSAKNGDLCKEM